MLPPDSTGANANLLIRAYNNRLTVLDRGTCQSSGQGLQQLDSQLDCGASTFFMAEVTKRLIIACTDFNPGHVHHQSWCPSISLHMLYLNESTNC